MDGALAALALGANAMSNSMAEQHAGRQFSREKKLMAMQNAINQSNALSAYQNTTTGMRMAGLNPALAENAGATQAAPVSKGTAAQAENVEFDPASMLMDAQARNLDAQTELTEAQTAKVKGVDTEHTRADIDLKIANKLFTNANKEKVDEETKSIRNTNSVFEAENASLSDFGQVMAEKWQKSDWYRKLAPDTKSTIDSIADGSISLSVGGLRAIAGVIRTQKDLSDADRSLVDNAFSNAITESMFNDKKVMEALKLMPSANLDKLKAETSEAIAHSRLLGIESKWQKDQYEAYKTNNTDYTYSQYMKNPTNENLIRWLVSAVNDKTNKLFDMAGHAASGAAAGYAAGKAHGAAGKSDGMIETPGSSGFNNALRSLNRSGSNGVQQFRWPR